MPLRFHVAWANTLVCTDQQLTCGEKPEIHFEVICLLWTHKYAWEEFYKSWRRKTPSVCVYIYWSLLIEQYFSTSISRHLSPLPLNKPLLRLRTGSPPAQFFLVHLRLQTGFPVCVWGRSRILRTSPPSAPSTGSGWYVYWDVNWDCASGNQGQQWTHSSSPSLSVAFASCLHCFKWAGRMSHRRITAGPFLSYCKVYLLWLSRINH